MRMRIVRVSKVPISNPAQAERLGSDSYFQLDVMADIGNRTYQKAGKEPIVYHKEYPVTCVAIDLPNWLLDSKPISDTDSAAGLGQVWYPRSKATGSGWFYRFWSYKTMESTQSMGESPLVVIDSIKLGNEMKDESGTASIPFHSGNILNFLIGILGVAGLWWFIRRPAKSKLRFK